MSAVVNSTCTVATAAIPVEDMQQPIVSELSATMGSEELFHPVAITAERLISRCMHTEPSTAHCSWQQFLMTGRVSVTHSSDTDYRTFSWLPGLFVDDQSIYT